MVANLLPKFFHKIHRLGCFLSRIRFNQYIDIPQLQTRAPFEIHLPQIHRQNPVCEIAE